MAEVAGYRIAYRSSTQRRHIYNSPIFYRLNQIFQHSLNERISFQSIFMSSPVHMDKPKTIRLEFRVQDLQWFFWSVIQLVGLKLAPTTPKHTLGHRKHTANIVVSRKWATD